MTKDTMIWQTLSMIIAGKVIRQDLPDTKELFVEKIVEDTMCIIDYSKVNILKVLNTKNCSEFAEILVKIYK